MTAVSAIQFNAYSQTRLDTEALKNGALQVMPAEFYRQFEQVDLSGFCLRHGLYCLPTIELVDTIGKLIYEVSRSYAAIEIGSGNGVLGKALGIPCTDNHMQSSPAIQHLYKSMGQPVVAYGKHVEKLDADSAVAGYAPEVVIAAWVTHKYNPIEHERGGNMFGVDEIDILRRIKRYIFVGHSSPHVMKPLFVIPHRIIRGDYIFSRSLDAQGNALMVWDNPLYVAPTQ